MGADTVAGALAAAIDDPEVEAILFRIDSGGGSAVASETHRPPGPPRRSNRASR